MLAAFLSKRHHFHQRTFAEYCEIFIAKASQTSETLQIIHKSFRYFQQLQNQMFSQNGENFKPLLALVWKMRIFKGESAVAYKHACFFAPFDRKLFNAFLKKMLLFLTQEANFQDITSSRFFRNFLTIIRLQRSFMLPNREFKTHLPILRLVNNRSIVLSNDKMKT